MNAYDGTPQVLGSAARILAAAIATTAILGSVTLLFDYAGQTPWVAAAHAAKVSRCDELHGSNARHVCLRAVLAARQAELRVAARGVSATSD